ILGTTPQGQGHQTIVSQIIADELGLEPRDITVVDEMDTFTRVWSISSGTYSSRFGSVGTSAAALAARKLRAKLLDYASHLMDVPVSDLEWRDGAARPKTGKGAAYSVKDLAGRAHWNTESLPDGMGGHGVVQLRRREVGRCGRRGELVEHVRVHGGGEGGRDRSRHRRDHDQEVRDRARCRHDHQSDDRRGADLRRRAARARGCA